MSKVSLESVSAEFRSGNSIPVERATFTRERMQEVLEAYAAAKVREALEAAIEICDAAYEQGRSEYRASCNPYFEGGCDVADSIESKIRALIPPNTTKGGDA